MSTLAEIKSFLIQMYKAALKFIKNEHSWLFSFEN